MGHIISVLERQGRRFLQLGVLLCGAGVVALLVAGGGCRDVGGPVHPFTNVLYGKLIDRLASTTNARILCTSTWFRKRVIDVAIHDACTSQGGRYVDLSPISVNPANQAGSERVFGNSGVAVHPGDRGMSAVAARLFDALRQ